MIMADGTVRRHRAGPHPALFRAAVGGYGLLGVILDVELERSTARSTGSSHVIDTADFPRDFDASVVPDDDVRMMYTTCPPRPASL